MRGDMHVGFGKRRLRKIEPSTFILQIEISIPLFLILLVAGIQFYFSIYSGCATMKATHLSKSKYISRRG